MTTAQTTQPIPAHEETIPISITHNLTRGFLWDIMTTMVECHYSWFRLSNVERNTSAIKDTSRYALYVKSFVAQEIDEDEDSNPSFNTTSSFVDAHFVAAAMQKMLQNNLASPRILSTVASACANNDASSIDRDIADCILQVVCFNELRYG